MKWLTSRERAGLVRLFRLREARLLGRPTLNAVGDRMESEEGKYILRRYFLDNEADPRVADFDRTFENMAQAARA